MTDPADEMTPIETTLASTAIKGASGPATNALKKWGRRKYDRFIALYTNSLSEYVKSSISQCSSVKNILYRNKLADTKDKYVNVCFSANKEDVTDESLVLALGGQRRILIRGRGGAGKTMFTKWAVLKLFETTLNHQKIPIYIELRDLQFNKEETPLEELVFRQVSNNRHRTSFNQFIEGVKAGIFLFVLDAVDEVKKDNRAHILKKINRFARDFPETSILLTSRDFPQVDGLIGFEEYRTRPLELKQAIEIIDKIDYSDEIREALKSDIGADKYKKHAFFLENPLLVTILLLTFDQSREIPTKRSAFYKRAFEALYERHDAAKDVDFARDQHAGLPMDDFEAVFSHFCFGTYVNSVYDFSDAELNDFFIESTKKTLGDAVDGKDVATDAVESVCLIVREGHDNVFVHRSFQEYFTGLFIKNYKDDDLGELIELALTHGRGENTLEFIFEMDQPSLEREYVIPILKRTNNKLNKYDLEDVRGIIKGISLFFRSVSVEKNSKVFAGLRLSEQKDVIQLFNLSMLYPETDLFRLFSKKGLTRTSFESYPYDLVEGSASSVKEERSDGSELIRMRFSPTSSEWIEHTPIPEQVRKYARDLSNLQKRLEEKYDESPPSPLDRFAVFRRDE